MANFSVAPLQERSKLFWRDPCLTKHGPQCPASELLVERHDGNPTIAMAEFDVASSLAHANEACFGQSPDGVCSREDRRSRRHAVRRKVAMIGGSKSSGRTSSSQ